MFSLGWHRKGTTSYNGALYDVVPVRGSALRRCPKRPGAEGGGGGFTISDWLKDDGKIGGVTIRDRKRRDGFAGAVLAGSKWEPCITTSA